MALGYPLAECRWTCQMNRNHSYSFIISHIFESLFIQIHDASYPRSSMYGIFTYIWVIYGVNVGKYTIHGWSGYGFAIIASPFSQLYHSACYHYMPGCGSYSQCLGFWGTPMIVTKGSDMVAIQLFVLTSAPFSWRRGQGHERRILIVKGFFALETQVCSCIMLRQITLRFEGVVVCQFIVFSLPYPTLPTMLPIGGGGILYSS